MPGESDIDLRRKKVVNGWLTRLDRRERGWDRPLEASIREHEREDVLASFVGEERSAEVLASLRPEARNAGDLADMILNDVDYASAELLHRIREHWVSIVGGANAKICRPLSIDGDALNIEVTSSSFLFVLNGQRSIIQRRVSEISGNAVKRIYLKQKGSI